MTPLARVATLRRHSRSIALVSAFAIIATACVLLTEGGARAGTASSEYAVLSSSGSGRLTPVSSTAQAEAASGPIINAQDPTLDAASAREAVSTVPGMRVWVAKGTDGGVCILALRPQPDRAGPRGPASGCTPPARLPQGASLEQFGASGEIYESGAVPDSVASVSVNLTNGESKTIAVHDNVYTVETSTPISTVTFTAEGVQQTTNVGGNQ